MKLHDIIADTTGLTEHQPLPKQVIAKAADLPPYLDSSKHKDRLREKKREEKARQKEKERKDRHRRKRMEREDLLKGVPPLRVSDRQTMNRE
jgi:hypothetical protein